MRMPIHPLFREQKRGGRLERRYEAVGACDGADDRLRTGRPKRTCKGKAKENRMRKKKKTATNRHHFRYQKEECGWREKMFVETSRACFDGNNGVRGNGEACYVLSTRGGGGTSTERAPTNKREKKVGKSNLGQQQGTDLHRSGTQGSIGGGL